MKRKIIQIDEEKCNGCGICVSACHEGAIGLVDGKARLLRDDYCDGLGDCLPACPTGAITFIEREAAAYDEAAVLAAKAQKDAVAGGHNDEHGGEFGHGSGHEHGHDGGFEHAHRHAGGCPSSNPRTLIHEIMSGEMATACAASASANTNTPTASSSQNTAELPSQLSQWPAQIKLVPINAPYFNGAHLLIAADCTAFAYASFHARFMSNHITLIGCPKLDDIDYTEKLSAIVSNNNILSVTIARMEVPCCGGLENAARRAVEASRKDIDFKVVTISIDGKILS